MKHFRASALLIFFQLLVPFSLLADALYIIDEESNLRFGADIKELQTVQLTFTSDSKEATEGSVTIKHQESSQQATSEIVDGVAIYTNLAPGTWQIIPSDSWNLERVKLLSKEEQYQLLGVSTTTAGGTAATAMTTGGTGAASVGVGAVGAGTAATTTTAAVSTAAVGAGAVGAGAAATTGTVLGVSTATVIGGGALAVTATAVAIDEVEEEDEPASPSS